jgi:hypothetical protein
MEINKVDLGKRKKVKRIGNLKITVGIIFWITVYAIKKNHYSGLVILNFGINNFSKVTNSILKL